MWTFEKWKERYWENRRAYLAVGAANSWRVQRAKFVRELLDHFPQKPEDLERDFGGVESFVCLLRRDYGLVRCLGRPLLSLLQKLHRNGDEILMVREIEEVLDGYIQIE